MIQFFAVFILELKGNNFGDDQYLYSDLIILLPLTITMGITGPYKRLTKHMPTGSLVSVPVLTSVLGSVVIQLIFDMIVYEWMLYEPWYKPYVFKPDGDISFEATVLFLFTSIQYLVTSIAFSLSKPFREPLYTNFWFTASLIILTAYSYYIILIPDTGSMRVFTIIKGIPMSFRWIMVGMTVINSICTYLYEKIAVWYIALYWKKRKDGIK
jgi:cation-transporting ATPase 13A3/4/5